MKTFKFTISVTGSAKGTVRANSREEALEAIKGGQWDDIDIDVEDVNGIEHLVEKPSKN